MGVWVLESEGHHKLDRAMYSDGVEAGREELTEFFSTVLPHLNELQRRMVPRLLSHRDRDDLATTTKSGLRVRADRD